MSKRLASKSATLATTERAKKAPKAEPFRKDASGWSYEAADGTWVSGFKNRDAARLARKAAQDGGTSKPEEEETPETETETAQPESTQLESTPIASDVPATETQNPLESSDASPVSSEKSNVIVNTANAGDQKMFNATKSSTNKGGATLFKPEGLSASVRLPKSLFATDASKVARIEVRAFDADGNELTDVFAKAGAAKAAKPTSEEEKAKIIANAEKAKARAEKAAARAAKAAAKAAAVTGESAPAQA